MRFSFLYQYALAIIPNPLIDPAVLFVYQPACHLKLNRQLMLKRSGGFAGVNQTRRISGYAKSLLDQIMFCN
jgi:hypothetical protein